MSESDAVAIPERPELPQIGDPVQLIAMGIQSGVDVETMERLLAMRQELERAAARKAFDEALSAIQGECPIIKKDTPGGKTKGGVVAYYYATLDSIIAQVGGLLRKHGFSYRFVCESPDNGVAVSCEARHIGGHVETSRVAVPLGERTGIMSAPQQAMAATTYAKRYAFCDAFGIATGDGDTDAAMEEAPSPPVGRKKNASRTDSAALQRKAFATATAMFGKDAALWAIRWHCLLAGRDNGQCSWSKSTNDVHGLVTGHLAAVDAGEDTRACQACDAAMLFAKVASTQGKDAAEPIAGATATATKPVSAAAETLQAALDQAAKEWEGEEG